MLNKDFDLKDDLGKLRSGKRYKLEGRKRNADDECKIYIDEGHSVVSKSDSGDYSDIVKRPETLEKLVTPEVRSTIPYKSESGTNNKESCGIPPKSTPPRKIMAGGEMNLPLFHENGSKDPQQHLFLCEVVWRVNQVINADMKVA